MTTGAGWRNRCRAFRRGLRLQNGDERHNTPGSVTGPASGEAHPDARPRGRAPWVPTALTRGGVEADSRMVTGVRTGGSPLERAIPRALHPCLRHVLEGRCR
jgi:hypothetical protein